MYDINNSERICDQDYERSLLSQMILDPSIIPKVLNSKLTLFYEGKHQIILSAIDYLHTEGFEVNQITLADHLRKEKKLDKIGGEIALAGICIESSSSAMHEDYIKVLKDLVLKREARRIVKTALSNLNDNYCGEDVIDYLRTEAIKINEDMSEKKTPLAEQIRSFIEGTRGDISVTEVDRFLNLGTKRDKENRKKIFQRLERAGEIERVGCGRYRKIDLAAERMDWINCPSEPYKIKFPFGIEKLVHIYKKNIIVIAGESNSGKTAFLLNTAKMNMYNQNIYYLNSEMGIEQLKIRLEKFKGVDLKSLNKNINFYPRSSDFADVIRSDDLNIIDFLEMSDDFFKVGGYINQIFNKLKKGIAIIAIQKNRGTSHGIGGERSLEKANLYLNLGIENTNGNLTSKITIRKAKNFAQENYNPNGNSLEFKLTGGCNFHIENDWYKDSDFLKESKKK